MTWRPASHSFIWCDACGGMRSIIVYGNDCFISSSHSAPGVRAPRNRPRIVRFIRSVAPFPLGLYGVVRLWWTPLRFNNLSIVALQNSSPLSLTIVTGELKRLSFKTLRFSVDAIKPAVLSANGCATQYLVSILLRLTIFAQSFSQYLDISIWWYFV